MDKNNWISVKKRLPKEFANVLAYVPGELIKIVPVDDSGEFDMFQFDEDKYSHKDVTHWQPLPEPPTTKGQ